MRHNPPRGGPMADRDGWRSPERVKRNWQDCRRYLRRYAAFMALALMVAAWQLGGLLGYWEGYADGLLARHENKESNNANHR